MQPIKPKKRTTVYLDPSIHGEFKEICDREGESMSLKIEGFIQNYVNIHRVGNPQTMLPRFGGELSLVCNRCGKGDFKTLHRVEYYTGYIAHACDDCLRRDKQNRLVKKDLGVI